jgi:uncharacterized membrane protein YfcA
LNAGLGALYGSLIIHPLPSSVHRRIVSVFMGATN